MTFLRAANRETRCHLSRTMDKTRSRSVAITRQGEVKSSGSVTKWSWWLSYIKDFLESFLDKWLLKLLIKYVNKLKHNLPDELLSLWWGKVRCHLHFKFTPDIHFVALNIIIVTLTASVYDCVIDGLIYLNYLQFKLLFFFWIFSGTLLWQSFIVK